MTLQTEQPSKNLFAPLVSIVIPARNEEEDIAETLEHCLAIEYSPKEIIVVDDSTDSTPEIVAMFADRGVRLVHRTVNHNGCCGARNLGMQEAYGEIVVIFNADNRPKRDFLQRLLVHYQNGADYVIVKSQVINTDDKWGQYVDSLETAMPYLDPEWSEGFSCRREAAKKIGYIPGDFPLPFCRDYLLGTNLNRAGFKKHIDLTIPVEHVVPNTLSSFWRNRVWRGTFSPLTQYYFKKRPKVIIALRELLKAGRTLLKYILILPALWNVSFVIRRTQLGWVDAPDLLVAMLVADAANTVGCFKGLWRLIKMA